MLCTLCLGLNRGPIINASDRRDQTWKWNPCQTLIANSSQLPHKYVHTREYLLAPSIFILHKYKPAVRFSCRLLGYKTEELQPSLHPDPILGACKCTHIVHNGQQYHQNMHGDQLTTLLWCLLGTNACCGCHYRLGRDLHLSEGQTKSSKSLHSTNTHAGPVEEIGCLEWRSEAT